MSAHTPGPWLYDREFEEVVRVVDDRREDGICLIDSSDEDGHLIAAAPEMLEALHRCVLALEVATTPLAEDREEVRSARELALKVVAKAEGRS